MRSALLSFLIPFCPPGLAQGPGPARAPATAVQKAPATVTLRGRIVTWQREPIAGACLAVLPGDTFDTRALLREPAMKSSADGTFTATVQPPVKGASAQVLHVAMAGRESRTLQLELQREPPLLEQDLGDIVLGEGGRLLGRVRTAEGRPLHGARVMVTDLLERPPFGAGMTSSQAACATVTGADGIFDLPCAVAQAGVVVCTAEGFFSRRLQPVATGTPLEIDLQPSGFLAGRVLDAEGSGVEGAQVMVAFELGAEGSEAVRTGKDGSFRCARTAPGRYRVRAWNEATMQLRGHQMANSAVGKDANETLELRLPAAEKGDDQRAFLRVRAVDKATGQPVPAFAAVSVFEEYANQSPPHLEQQLRSRMREPEQAKAGEARVLGPNEGEPPLGAVRVLAEGYAVATRDKVEWQAPGEGEPEPLVTVELLPEATLAGRVVDETTGAPLTGVRVFCVPQLEPMHGHGFDPGMPPDAVLTGKDGSFVIGSLGAGRIELRAQLAGRPPLPPVDLELGAAEQRTGLELKLPAGATVSLRIAGMPEAAAGRVVLAPLPGFDGHLHGGQMMWQDFGMVTFDDMPMMPAGGNGDRLEATASAAGVFRFTGVAEGHYMALVELPSEPRSGQPIGAQVEPFRVRRAGLERELDGSEDRPGTVAGKVTFKQGAIPFERLLAVLHPASSGFEHPLAIHPGGRRTLVARDGAFRLRAAPGRYRLRLLDLATGCELWSSDRPLEVKPGGEVEVAAAPVLSRLRVELAAAERERGFAASRLEVRVVPPSLRASHIMQGTENWDSGRGVDLQPGQTEVELVLPAGLVILLARSNAAHLLVEGDHEALRQPLGRAEIEVKAGEAETRARVEVAPPPEIPEPAGR